MRPGDYERLKQLVLEARAIPAERRAAWLDAACGDDPALRAELETLLAHDETPDPRMGTGAVPERFAGELAAAVESGREPMPDRVGPYRIREPLGSGGMGTVYRAEQDEPIRREVAFKRIRSGLASAELVRRFEAERATLARMEHPFIARVLDAGADPRVGPYVVMELVRGEPISSFCDRHRLTVRDRIELFLLVCEAVQHAHRKGVLHRDLKPSNVLVTREQERSLPKIIDFGIARVIEGDSAGEGGAAGLTQGATFLGTPEYMSPEQAGAVPGGVDTRTDVYSLGVLLYELLTGHRPFRFPSDRPADVLRVLSSEEPGRPSTAVTRERGAALTRERGAAPERERPPHRRTAEGSVAESRRTTPARLRRALAGDLDAIVLQALCRDPRGRYPSVEHLADDLRRHLEGRAVTARRGAWTYHAVRFGRRHRVAVTAAAGVALALVSVAVVSVVQSRRLERERDRAVVAEQRARAEADASRQVATFLRNLFHGASPAESRGEPVTARELLDRGARSVDEDLKEQPALQGRMLRELGEVYHTLGLYDQADTLLRRSLERIDAGPPPREAERAATLELLGVVAQDRGDLEASAQHHREALTLLRALHPGPHEDVARILNYLAGVLQAAGDLESAEPLFREALATNQQLFGTRHVEVAWGQSTLGWALQQQAQYAAAESLYRVALATQVELLGERHPDVGHTLNNLAGVRWQLGDYAEAEAVWRRALAVYQALYPDGHPAVSRGMFNLARVLRSRGAFAEADSLNAASLELARAMLGPTHPSVVNHMVGLAGTALDRGRAAEAERLARQGLAMRLADGSRETVPIAGTEETLALALIARGHPREALGLARHALSVRLARQGAEHPEVAASLVCLGRAREAAGDFPGADSSFSAALDLRRLKLGAEHPLTYEAAAYLGLLRSAHGRRSEAEPLLASAARGLPEALPLRARAQASLADVTHRP